MLRKLGDLESGEVDSKGIAGCLHSASPCENCGEDSHTTFNSYWKIKVILYCPTHYAYFTDIFAPTRRLQTTGFLYDPS